MLISYVFRGEDVDIDVTDRSEPYEWLFYGKTIEEHDALKITPEEDAAIYLCIAEALYDRAANANPFED